jgi:hypothetical protein
MIRYNVFRIFPTQMSKDQLCAANLQVINAVSSGDDDQVSFGPRSLHQTTFDFLPARTFTAGC